jgi:nitroreductase
MELEEAMRTQRAIRRLRPDPVDDQLVLELIELALKAPTGGNQQNWEFVVVKDREVKRRLGRLNMQSWRLYGGIGRLVMRRRPSMLRVIDASACHSRRWRRRATTARSIRRCRTCCWRCARPSSARR